MPHTLLICLFFASFFPVIQASKAFYQVWSEEELSHWQQMGRPSFAVFHLGMLCFYVPLVLGRECDSMGNQALLVKRKALRFFLLIQSLLLLATHLNYLHH